MALTDEERAWALDELQRYIDDQDLDYADNIRVAERGTDEEYNYDDVKNGGCCGSFDTELFYRPTAKWILIGCNYGH